MSLFHHPIVDSFILSLVGPFIYNEKDNDTKFVISLVEAIAEVHLFDS